MGHAIVVRLDNMVGANPAGDGVHWGIETSDLNVNLVHLDPLSAVETHLNLELDVVVLGLAGSGWLWLGEEEHVLGPHVLALVPKGTVRSISASHHGVTYMTFHRRRSPLRITLGRSESGNINPVATMLDAINRLMTGGR